MADNAPKVVEAQQFLLRDGLGGIRAALTLGYESLGEHLPRFSNDVVLSPKSPDRYIIGADGNPSLLLFDERGTLRARLSTWASGAPTLELGDENGKRRIMLTVQDFSQSGLIFLGEDPKSRAGFYVGEDGRPELRLGNLVLDARYQQFLRRLPVFVGAALASSILLLVRWLL